MSTSRHLPGTATMAALWHQAVADRGSSVFCELVGGSSVTYAEADAWVGQLASELGARGVGHGDRVALQAEKSLAGVVLYLACITSGIVLLPLNTGYTDAETTPMLADAGARMMVRDSDALLTGSPQTTKRRIDRTVSVGPDDIATLLYTSGTTGTPKGAPLTQHNLAANALTLKDAWGFTRDDVLVHVLPTYHAHGLFVAINTVIASGCSMRFADRFDPALTSTLLDGATVLMAVPTHYTRLLAHHGFTREACRTMRLFISGSAPLTPQTHAEFFGRTGHVILERYGMTETIMLTSNPLDGERRAGTVGPPLPGVSVRVCDDDDQMVEVGETGAVQVSGPSVFGGYWQRPELNATEFTADGWFRTGDLGRFDDDGYLTLVGRSKDLVITGGLNVYPIEVERVLDDLDDVAESAVIGCPDADFGERVVAIVVARVGAVLDPDAVREAARGRLAGFKVPKVVHLVDELPRNAMGKVDKKALRARFCQ
jgi:malonyl-CoA/methylmalonyl-CoA synthetase